MTTYTIPRKTFDPHPTGRHTGTITNIQDEGVQESPWGEQHKISIRIDSDTAIMDSGEPFSIIQWFSLSSSPKSNLRKIREAVLDRSLTRTEEENFVSETELIGKRISYRVEHKEKQDGGLRAVIREGSVEPFSDGSDSNGSQGAGESETPTDDDLPF
jgi:hypothetical protein